MTQLDRIEYQLNYLAGWVEAASVVVCVYALIGVAVYVYSKEEL